tara:strand:- start:125 stop:1234 length:1110 start_codon:yes stop_codon:yes gene_type:complete
MTYSIRESNNNDKKLINDFNKELKSQGFHIRLPIPHTENLNNKLIFENSFILIENKITVRAGYTLKNQLFKINDELIQIGYYYRPVSAGLYNKKYNICGILLLNDAQKKNPNLFGLGMGGYSEPLPQLFKSLNWNLKKVPFFFKICNPNLFLKNIKYLKNNKLKSFLILLAQQTGLGWVSIKITFLMLSLINFRPKKKQVLAVEEIVDFDREFDLIWENAKKHYSFIAVRNREYLKILYSDQKFIKLKFIENNQVIGWSISLCSELNNHNYFGNMKLGSIVDCLSLKGYEKTIIKKTSEILKNKGVDLIISNQSHIFWKKAFKLNSFIGGPSNYVFASSKILSEKLLDNKKQKDHIHLTRGDGDGPINL